VLQKKYATPAMNRTNESSSGIVKDLTMRVTAANDRRAAKLEPRKTVEAEGGRFKRNFLRNACDR
jgi:hypothetical protein